MQTRKEAERGFLSYFIDRETETQKLRPRNLQKVLRQFRGKADSRALTLDYPSLLTLPCCSNLEEGTEVDFNKWQKAEWDKG